MVVFRHKLFDLGILKSKEYDIPIICVGNITVGGTGKTPTSELLIASLKDKYNIALLSRGYKRKTKGYLEVEINSSYFNVGDEPKQIKRKFQDIVVAVCEKRAEGIEMIRKNHSDVNLIILDDGFQHRYVEPWVNVVLMDFNRPVYEDSFLPVGNLRDTMSQLHRANVIIITKCPSNITSIQKRVVRKYLNMYPYQSLYFSEVKSQKPRPIFKGVAPEKITSENKVIALAGIANAEGFISGLSLGYEIVNKVIYPDHHSYQMRDLRALSELLKNSDNQTVIVTTEKDAVKLTNAKQIPIEIQKSIYYVPIEMEIMDNQKPELLEKLKKYVRENQKYGLQH